MEDKNWITIELTNNCNLRCPYCSQFSSLQKPKGFMEFLTFTKIIDSLVKNKTNLSNIDLFFRGESLLHPRFSEMLDYLYESARQHQICEYIKLHTNAEFLTKENTEAILKVCDQAVLKHPGDLFLSIDAATAKTHNIVRPGGNFQKIVENIKYFLKRREEKNQFGPSMVFQFIIQPENSHEAQIFLDYWANYFKSLGIEYYVDKSLGPELPCIKRTTIYFRRLSSWHEEREKNKSLQKQIMKEMELVE